MHNLKVSLSPQDAYYKGKRISFTVEKHDRHHPKQEIKVNITSHKNATSRASEYDREECVTFVVFLPQMHNANLKKEENTREPN